MILKHCDSLTNHLIELARFQPSIQMASAIHLSAGPDAALRSEILGVKESLKNRKYVDEDHTESEATGETISRTSTDEQCPKCGSYFPWNAHSLHIELCTGTVGTIKVSSNDDQQQPGGNYNGQISEDGNRHLGTATSTSTAQVYQVENPERGKKLRSRTPDDLSSSENENEPSGRLHVPETDSGSIQSRQEIKGKEASSPFPSQISILPGRLSDLVTPSPQESPRNSNILASWNDNLQPDIRDLGISHPKSQTSSHSIVTDFGYPKYIADNRRSTPDLSTIQQASWVPSTGGNFTDATIILEPSVGFEHENLGDSIRAALVVTPSRHRQEFLPNDALDRIVTRQRIRYELSNHQVCLPEELDQLTDRVWEITTHFSSLEKQPRQTTRRRLFGVLGLMDKIEAIVDFINENLYDSDLPFILAEGPRRGLRQFELKGGEEPIQLFSKWETFRIEYFNSCQWRFTVPYFRLEEKGRPKHYLLEKETILPFVKDEELDAHVPGVLGDFWRVEIHPAHHNLCEDSVRFLFSKPYTHFAFCLISHILGFAGKESLVCCEKGNAQEWQVSYRRDRTIEKIQ